MNIFKGVFKSVDLSPTLSTFFYKTLQKYFSMVDKNEILWSWAKDVMSCAQQKNVMLRYNNKEQ